MRVSLLCAGPCLSLRGYTCGACDPQGLMSAAVIQVLPSDSVVLGGCPVTTAQDIDAIIGAARPVVDKAIDQAALLVFDAVLDWADRAQSEYPGAPPDAHELYTSPTYAYHMGWDDALSVIRAQVRAARNRIQGFEFTPTREADDAKAY